MNSFKLGEELTGSTNGHRAKLALRCCNVPIPVASSSQGAVCTSLVASLMADSSDATTAIPNLVR